MAVYPRGKKGVYYMDFTLYGKRILKSTGKYTPWAARLAEAKERKRIEKNEKPFTYTSSEGFNFR